MEVIGRLIDEIASELEKELEHVEMTLDEKVNALRALWVAKNKCYTLEARYQSILDLKDFIDKKRE